MKRGRASKREISIRLDEVDSAGEVLTAIPGAREYPRLLREREIDRQIRDSHERTPQAGRILGVTTREQAHRLLDELPESEVEPVVEFIVSRGEGDRHLDEWGDLDRFSARASRGVLRHMTEEEEEAGFSWEKYR